MTNWAGNVAFSTDRLVYPESVEQVQEIVSGAEKVRAVGSRHSFNDIADTTGIQISLEKLNRVVSLDSRASTVTVEPGVKYGDLAALLDANGRALHNLASVQHITVAGAVATATHGSGVNNGNLATAVTAMEIVKADGELISLTRKNDGDRFCGAVVGLGALGIVTSLTLEIQPRFSMAQQVYRNMPMAALVNFEEIMSSGYSVSLFTDWSRGNINQVWIKTRVGDTQVSTAENFFGATLATRHMHTIDEQSAETCTEQMGLSGSWCDRLPHFKREFNPASGQELQSEYFVPIKQAYEAIMALEALHDQITPYLFISEIRAIAADDLWMSPCYKKACASVHMTWKPDWNGVRRLLPLIEEKLAPFNALPHWGKLFAMSPRQLQAGFEQLGAFKDLASHLDPAGKFRNDFLLRNLYGGQARNADDD